MIKTNILFWVIITCIVCILFLFIYENLSSTVSISSQDSNRTQNKINYVTEYNLNGDILECTVVDKISSPFVWRKSGVDTIGLIKFRIYKGKIGVWKNDLNKSNLIYTDISILNELYKKFKLDSIFIKVELSKIITIKNIKNRERTNLIAKNKKRTFNPNENPESHYPLVEKNEPIQKNTIKQNSKPATGVTTKNADEL
jgi:hypothetical protein